MTTIEWTRNPDGSKGKSWNPIRARNKATGRIGWHCEHVHEGCKCCYAEAQNKNGARGGTKLPYKPGHRDDVEIYLDEKVLLAPLKWKKPQRIFVCSMTDLFGAWVRSEWLDKIFAVMALCPQHTFIVPTKRAARMREYLTNQDLEDRLTELWRADDPERQTWNILLPLRNIWGLVSCSEQKDADKFIPELLQTPLAKRGVSLEPLLGPIDLMMLKSGDKVYDALQGCIGSHVGDGEYEGAEPCAKLDWVIVGGESGKGARPMHPDWARSLRDQCESAGVPFFFKQWGSWYPIIDRDREDPDWRRDYTVTNSHPKKFRTVNLAGGMGFHGERVHLMQRYSKKNAGRLLDGREHNEFPVAA